MSVLRRRSQRNKVQGRRSNTCEGSGRRASVGSKRLVLPSLWWGFSPPPLCVLQVVLFEFENFQGCKVEFSSDCKDVTEKGLEKVGSIIIESGP